MKLQNSNSVYLTSDTRAFPFSNGNQSQAERKPGCKLGNCGTVYKVIREQQASYKSSGNEYVSTSLV